MNAAEVHRHFKQFECAKTKHEIEMIDIWNMNESDFQVEVDCDQWVIVSVVEEKTH